MHKPWHKPRHKYRHKPWHKPSAQASAQAFYRGSQPFVMRAMLVGGTQLAAYD